MVLWELKSMENARSACRIVSVTIALTSLLCSCDAISVEPQEPSDNIYTSEVQEQPAAYVIDVDNGGVAGVNVGMSEQELWQIGFSHESYTENLEGDEYKIVDIVLPNGSKLKCTFDLSNFIYRIESTSTQLRDKLGNGVGSHLEDLERSYPEGRLAIGLAEDRYSRFLTGTHLVFVFSPREFAEECFEDRTSCTFDRHLRAISVSIEKFSLN